jgi:hypothetical protein
MDDWANRGGYIAGERGPVHATGTGGMNPAAETAEAG